MVDLVTESLPQTLHFVWIGDEDLRPNGCIETWRRQHPDFELRIWGNKDLSNRDWILRGLMEEVMSRNGPLCSVADLMRWEILLKEGGFAIDADSVCIRPLPDFLFECEFFAVWVNEYLTPGLIANGYVGARANHPVIQALVNRLLNTPRALTKFSWSSMKRKLRPAWHSTGPRLLTETIQTLKDPTVSILPSHMFIPIHHSGWRYQGAGPVYSCELFASTYSSDYKTLHGENADTLVSRVMQDLYL